MDPILEALNSEQLAQAIRDYVLAKRGVDPALVGTVRVSYNNSPAGMIAAVAIEPATLRKPPARAEKASE